MMKKFAGFMIAALFALSVVPALAQDATPEATPEATSEMTAMFNYDQSKPLDVTTTASEMRGDVTVKTISYSSPVTSKPIGAYLVVPTGNGPFPAIEYVHWYEPSSANSNKTEFLDEAVMMAQKYGVESILVDTMWSDPDWYDKGRSLDSDYTDAIRQVIELRHGLDVLLAQPNVDSSRVAYVGHDFGAMYGALLSGVDHRAKAYVFIAGASDFNHWMLFGVDDSTPGLAAYKAKMETIAPTIFVPLASPSAIYFQDGTQDKYTPQSDVDAFLAAANEPKDIKMYKSGHAMASAEIQMDRVNFLVSDLDLQAK
jgi:dienelactone hydrolase